MIQDKLIEGRFYYVRHLNRDGWTVRCCIKTASGGERWTGTYVDFECSIRADLHEWLLIPTAEEIMENRERLQQLEFLLLETDKIDPELVAWWEGECKRRKDAKGEGNEG